MFHTKVLKSVEDSERAVTLISSTLSQTSPPQGGRFYGGNYGVFEL